MSAPTMICADCFGIVVEPFLAHTIVTTIVIHHRHTIITHHDSTSLLHTIITHREQGGALAITVVESLYAVIQ